MDFKPIGKQIKKYRTAAKLRQADVAEKIGLGDNYIGMLERGEKAPSLESFINIANALSVSADQLLCDVLDTGYRVKDTEFSEKMSRLDPQDRERIYKIIDTFSQRK